MRAKFGDCSTAAGNALLETPRAEELRKFVYMLRLVQPFESDAWG
jgi:hypothetical protein